jgi:TonB family protein
MAGLQNSLGWITKCEKFTRMNYARQLPEISACGKRRDYSSFARPAQITFVISAILKALLGSLFRAQIKNFQECTSTVRISPKALMMAAALFLLLPLTATAQDGRKVKKEVAPVYPAMAREMHVAGSVKLDVTIAPSGKVISAKPLGGHPLLVQSAMDAIQKFQYEPATAETNMVVVFNFTN